MEYFKKPKWRQMTYWEKVYWLQKTYNLLLMQAKYAVDQCLPFEESVSAAKLYDPFKNLAK